MKREHINELNVTRALAILAVLFIHSTSASVITLPSDSVLFPFYVFLNVFSKFAVPIFIFLSDFVLFYNYIQKDLTKSMITGFYKKRLNQILIPYLFFSVFYYMVVNYSATSDFKLTLEALFSGEFLDKLLIGKAYTHLYYIFIMIQFYLMFPVFLYILKKKPALSHHLIWIGFVLQWGFIFFNAEIWQYKYKGSISLSYIFFFLSGAYLGIYYEKCKKWVKVKKEDMNLAMVTLWGVWIASSMYNVYLYYYVYSSQTYLVNSKMFELIWQIQSITASIVLLQLSFWIYAKWNATVVNCFINLGALSFGVFLLHPYFLFLYRKNIPLSGNSLIFHTSSLGGFLFSLFLSWAIVFLIGKYIKLHWIAFGPIPQNIHYKESKSQIGVSPPLN
jgi:probable poly-beta-1,6-N-acetyl-D-glucosamine export protein